MWVLSCVLLSIWSRTQANRMMPLTFRTCLPTSAHSRNSITDPPGTVVLSLWVATHLGVHTADIHITIHSSKHNYSYEVAMK